MSKRVFQFNSQLQVGNIGEQFFLDNYPATLEKFSGRECDFKLVETGGLIEVKTDTYDAEKTENFFFERWSNQEKKTPGGPWRAKKDKIDIFCYLFINNKLCYEFGNMRGLVKRLNWLIKKIPPTEVKNRGFVTIGYKVPRKDLEGLYHLWDFNKKED